MGPLSRLLARAAVAWAHSPHVYYGEGDRYPSFSVESQKLTIEAYNQNTSVLANPLFTRQGTGDPTEAEQEGRVPPMFAMRSCLFCPPESDLQGDGRALLAKFTTAEFIRTMRAYPIDLQNTCMFYTQSRQVPPVALSRRATQLACKYRKYSIWHLWPNSVQERQDPKSYLNYYGLANPDSRIYKIWTLPTDSGGKPGYIEYFENMSRAMASQCSGDVFVLSDSPEDLYYYVRIGKNIFATTEWPALKANRLSLGRFIAIDNRDTNDPPRAWKVDIDTLILDQNSPVPAANWRRGDDNVTRAMPPWFKPYDLSLELKKPWSRDLEKRASALCSNSGVNDEASGQDYFG